MILVEGIYIVSAPPNPAFLVYEVNGDPDFTPEVFLKNLIRELLFDGLLEYRVLCGLHYYIGRFPPLEKGFQDLYPLHKHPSP